MARMRVYELARELGVDTKTVLAVLADLDRSVKSASSTIDREGAAAVRSRLVGERGPGGEKPGRDSDDQSPDIDAGALAREIAELSRRLPGELGQKYAAQIVPELLTPGSIPPQELAATAELLRGMVEDSDGSSGPVHEPPSTQREGDVAADSPLASAPHEERSPSSPEEQFDLRRWVEAAVPDFARAMLDLVVLDREDRREANASLFRALEVQCPPLTDPRYFRACLIAGAWCRDATPHPDESTRWRSLWFAGLWATAYETATGANSTANRWNQFSGLTERAPHGIVPSLVGEFAPVLSACLPSAREKALSALASALESGTSEAERDLLLRVEQSLNAVPQISSPSHPATHRAQSWSSPRLRAALEVIFSSTLSDNEAAESLIEVWGFLDPEKEEINRGRLAVGGAHELALLAGGAARSGDWRLHNLPPHKLDPIDQYVDLARLAIYSHHHGVVGDGEVAQLVLDFAGYRPLVEGSIDEGQYIEIVNRVVQAFPERDREVLKLAVEVATSVLARQADASQGARWLAALGRSQYTRLVPADSLRTLLARLEAVGTPESVGLLALKESVSVSDLEGGSAYMTAEDEHELKTLYKRGAVQQIVELIQPFQVGLVTALSHKLANPDSFTTYRTPAMSGFAYTGRDERSFHTLRSKAREGNTDEARAAREAFDAALTKRNRSSTETAVLREWRDYAAMRAESVLVVIPSWQHDFDQGSASNEVAWNLAVYYALQNQYAPALGYLDRGISSFKAPYDHLIFGVYLSLQLLLQSRSSGSDRELAEDFLQVNARLLVDPEAQLLWVLLAGRQPGQDFLGEAATRITNYMALKDEPVSVPDPGTWRSPDPRAARGLLNDLKSQMTKYGDNGSWRLWLNGYLPNNRHWYPAWEYVASACEEAGDFDTAWRVMQEATDEFLRGYKRAAKRGADPARKAAGTLRQALQRLCSLTKRTNRTSNFQIYYDKYVAHVPELSLDLPANRTLVIYLGEHSERDSEVARPSGPVTGRESGAAWTSLAFPLFEVQTFGDFDQKLVERLDAALSMAPIPVQEQGVRARLEGLLQQVGVCRDSGVSQDEVSGVVQGLTGELAFVDTTIREGQFDHLMPLAGALRRALERFAQQAGAVPLLEVRAPSNWSGFSTDADESQIVLEVRNPGPGAMADIHLRAAWEGQEPMDALAGLSSLEEETPDCVVVDLPQSGVSGAQVVFEAEFDWGPVRQARTGGEVDVPLSNFASHLRQHGVTTHEFPDPFVADGPLAGDQLGTSLFQGREKELDLALSYYGGSRRPATPLCFFGIRRTGKTTLLRRIARELTERGVPTVEFSLMGLRADQMDLNALTLAFVSYLVEEARRQHPASGFTFSVPTEHPAPILVVEDCFRSLQHSLGSNLVLLIDEFQLLFYPAGEVLLDRLRACHESDALRFIAFANQGHDLMINTGSQLVLDSHRVDFLSEDETQRLLSEPLVEMGIAVHEGALREIYRLTGGHPNFTGKLAKMAVENLNQARRTMIVAEDLRRGARQIIDVPGLFGVSWFSKLNLSEDEMALAVNFAKAAKGKPGLTVSEIKDLAFDWRLLNDLEEKLVLTTQESRVAIRGTLLQMHLESKLGLAPVPTDGRNSRPAVGLFIDLENSDVGRSLSVDAATFAERLLTFSATFGAVVTAHAAAKPWHLADFFDVKLTLEAARIAVAEVPVELKRKNQGIEKNLIDMMINDLVTEAINDFNVSVVVLVTGDVDHYTMIVKSLERGVAVRLVSLDGQSRAKVYDRLAADRLALAVAQGRQVPDFLVWDLEDVLSGRAVSATHSGTSAN